MCVTTHTHTHTHTQRERESPLLYFYVNSFKIKRDEAEEWCTRNGVLNYFETSAKDNINLQEAFLSVAREVIKFRGETSQDADTDGDRTVALYGGEDQSRSRGCEC